MNFKRLIPVSLLLIGWGGSFFPDARFFSNAWGDSPASAPEAHCDSDHRIDRPWNKDVIYFALSDRFCDGDPSNNQPPGCDQGLYDPSQSKISRYHGGDFRGIERAIESGYFNKLGVTAIWLTPPVANAWRSPFDLGGPKTGYHGYWAQDFLDIDPHLVSRTSLDGAAYSDDRDGRMQHYKDLVALAHVHGIKVIQDVVCNHTGPLFFYDANGNGTLDTADKSEWIAPYSNQPRTDTIWNNEPSWNLIRPQPDGPQTILGRRVNTTGLFQDFNVYGRRGFNNDSLGKSDGEEVTCDFLSLRDFATSGDSDHFDALVDEFVEIYHFYIDFVGVDGLRLDTVKHVHHEFWSEFTHRLRERLGPDASRLLISGEVYDGNPRALGKYTYSVDADGKSRSTAPCLDSLLNFQFCFNLRDYLRKPTGSFGDAWGLRGTVDAMNQEGDDAFYNPTPGPDGLRPRQKMINFIENHDGLNRFLVQDMDPHRQVLASVILLTSEGIPCIYYGGEASLVDRDGVLGRDSETGRMTYCRGGDLSVLTRATESDSFQTIQRLTALRRENVALTDGRITTLWADRDDSSEDDGIYVFARYMADESGVDPTKTVLIAVNANPDHIASVGRVILATDGPNPHALLRSGDRLVPCDLPDAVDGGAKQDFVRVSQGEDGEPASVALSIPPSSAMIYVVERSDER